MPFRLAARGQLARGPLVFPFYGGAQRSHSRLPFACSCISALVPRRQGSLVKCIVISKHRLHAGPRRITSAIEVNTLLSSAFSSSAERTKQGFKQISQGIQASTRMFDPLVNGKNLGQRCANESKGLRHYAFRSQYLCQPDKKCCGDHGGLVVRLLAFQLGEPDICTWESCPDDVAGRRVFSGIGHFPRPFIPALLHTHFTSSSSAHKTSIRARSTKRYNLFSSEATPDMRNASVWNKGVERRTLAALGIGVLRTDDGEERPALGRLSIVVRFSAVRGYRLSARHARALSASADLAPAGSVQILPMIVYCGSPLSSLSLSLLHFPLPAPKQTILSISLFRLQQPPVEKKNKGKGDVYDGKREGGKRMGGGVRLALREARYPNQRPLREANVLKARFVVPVTFPYYVQLYLTGDRGGLVVRLLASQLREPGSIPGGAAPRPSHVGIVPSDASGRRVFSGISRFPPPPHSGAAPSPPRFINVGSQDLIRTAIFV
ncbi:hypothetical protein PR048_002763 [Dryococelus australis]|uniref:Uncharacterized protein n=1 Tax=Dryococelus australis TaxID=614101 RepID=A0ABQ9IL92_9NEOP|nr:hypothetical protein PR048_002763 [Dryococelus australis]